MHHHPNTKGISYASIHKTKDFSLFVGSRKVRFPLCSGSLHLCMRLCPLVTSRSRAPEFKGAASASCHGLDERHRMSIVLFAVCLIRAESVISWTAVAVWQRQGKFPRRRPVTWHRADLLYRLPAVVCRNKHSTSPQRSGKTWPSNVAQPHFFSNLSVSPRHASCTILSCRAKQQNNTLDVVKQATSTCSRASAILKRELWSSRFVPFSSFSQCNGCVEVCTVSRWQEDLWRWNAQSLSS